jgi:hypothetical protein
MFSDCLALLIGLPMAVTCAGLEKIRKTRIRKSHQLRVALLLLLLTLSYKAQKVIDFCLVIEKHVKCYVDLLGLDLARMPMGRFGYELVEMGFAYAQYGVGKGLLADCIDLEKLVGPLYELIEIDNRPAFDNHVTHKSVID